MRLLVRIRRFFFKPRRPRSSFADNPKLQREALQRSIEIRKQKAALRLEQLKSQMLIEKKKQVRASTEIAEYVDPDKEQPEDPFNADQIIMSILTKAMGARDGQSSNTTLPLLPNSLAPVAPPAHQTLTEAEIEQEIKKIPPNYLKMAKSMPEPLIKAYARKHFDLDDQTLDIAIKKIKNTGADYIG